MLQRTGLCLIPFDGSCVLKMDKVTLKSVRWSRQITGKFSDGTSDGHVTVLSTIRLNCRRLNVGLLLDRGSIPLISTMTDTVVDTIVLAAVFIWAKGLDHGYRRCSGFLKIVIGEHYWLYIIDNVLHYTWSSGYFWHGWYLAIMWNAVWNWQRYSLLLYFMSY